MIGISYGNYAMTAGQTKYQTANKSKKSNENDGFGAKLINGQYYIKVKRNEKNCDFPTFEEVDKIPAKYAVKEDGLLAMCWKNPGAEYRLYQAAESTEENPVVIARGVDEHGKLFEEKIDVRQINPYNTNQLELNALSFCRPGEHRTIGIPNRGDGLGLQDRFDFITGCQEDIRAGKRLHLSKVVASIQEDMDFVLAFTKGSARPDKPESPYTVDADALAAFARENERNLELYSSAARERMISNLARKCSEDLSDMLWKKQENV